MTDLSEPDSSGSEAPSSAENTAKEQRGRPFEKGVSGNPAGRPKGARNKATILAEKMLEAEAGVLARRLVEAAISGDGPALRMCVARLLPPKREERLGFEFPDLKTLADVPKALQAIAKALADGTIDCGRGELLARVVRDFQAAQENIAVYKRGWYTPSPEDQDGDLLMV